MIDTKGRPQDIQVKQSAEEDLDKSVITAARKFRYRPATLDGQPVRVRIDMRFSFEPPQSVTFTSNEISLDSLSHLPPGLYHLPPGVYEISGSVKPPKLIHSADPQYPYAARTKRRSGECVVRMIVNIEGRPTDVQAVTNIGHGFEKSAVEAVKQYRFQPATLNGKPVPVQMDVIVRFSIY